MELSNLKKEILLLSISDRDILLKEVKGSLEDSALALQASRRHILDNKKGECPHCSHNKYVRFGIDRGAQRYKCKSCNRSFT